MSLFGNFGKSQASTSNMTTPQAGGSVFGGASTQQQQPAGGGLFGNLPTPQNQSTASQAPLSFGNPTQQTQGPSLFGNTSNTTASTNTNTGGGGLFGAQNTPANTNQGASGGGLFGSQQPQSTGGGLFGGASNQQQQPAGGGLFGGNTQQQQQPNTTGGGLFGNNSQQGQQQQPLQGGGLFGNTSQQQPNASGGGGGIFGNSAQQQSGTSGGGGIFGTNNTQTGGGGLFGGSKPGGIFGSSLNINTNTSGASNPSANTNPNPLFGGSLNQPQQQQQQQGSIFPQPAQNQQQPLQRSTLFGSAPGQSTSNSNTLFGGGNNPLSTSALGTNPFGGGTGTAGGGGLGMSLAPNNLLSSRVPTVPVQQQADSQAQYLKLTQTIEGIYNAWNPSSQQCRFQHLFYNLVNPNQVGLYRQPPNVAASLWEKATRENPDPTCLVPVIATGFDDIRERVEAQSRQAEEHKNRLKDLKTRLVALTEVHTLSNVSRLQRASSQQTQLTQRLLAFIQHLHLLIPAIRSSSIRPEEEQLRGKLEEIEEEMRRGRVKGKLNELWALIGTVSASKDRGRGGAGNGGEWAVVDEEGLSQITQILAEQQAGLAHLTKTLQKDLKDLRVIMGSEASGSGGGEDVYASDGDSLWNSTSTLQVSTLR